MGSSIKLDVISDVVCPWCIIGYKRLLQAIDELGIQDRVELEWQPFELNREMPSEGEELSGHMSRKYGSTLEEVKRTADNIVALGTELDFKFDFFEGMRMVNTLDAHVLLDYAKTQGVQTELKLQLFGAYFNGRKDISDREVLLHEAAKVGLNTEELSLYLDNETIRKEIEVTEAQWHQKGVASVPTFVFNRTSALSGAQSVETFKQVLTEILAADT